MTPEQEEAVVKFVKENLKTFKLVLPKVVPDRQITTMYGLSSNTAYMYKKYPDIIRTPGGPLVKQRLVECLEEVWGEIPRSFFRALYKSMVCRVAAVIR